MLTGHWRSTTSPRSAEGKIEFTESSRTPPLVLQAQTREDRGGKLMSFKDFSGSASSKLQKSLARVKP
jgi:hypothetical protein